MRTTKTSEITYGAVLTAIFAVMLLLNRQTGGMFQELFIFALPMPMTAYTVKYGFKSGAPALAAMCLSSFFFGTFTTIFYACSQALIGYIFGGMLFHKKDPTAVLFTVMGLSGISSLTNLVLDALLFGYDITAEVLETKEMVSEAMTQASANMQASGGMSQADLNAMLETTFNTGLMTRMVFVASVAMGLLEGFIIFQLTLLVLKRLQFPVEKPKPVFLYFPPRPVGYLAAFLFAAYYFSMMIPFEDAQLQTLVQAGGMCGYIYLLVFGFLGAMLYMKKRMHVAAGVGFVLSLLMMMIFPFLLLAFGFLYTCTGWHYSLLEEGASSDQGQ